MIKTDAVVQTSIDGTSKRANEKKKESLEKALQVNI